MPLSSPAKKKKKTVPLSEHSEQETHEPVPKLCSTFAVCTERPCTSSQLNPRRARAKFCLLLQDDSFACQLGGAKLSPLIADSFLRNSAKDVPDASYSQQRVCSSCSDPAPFQLVGSHQTPLISLCADCVLCLIFESGCWMRIVLVAH